METDRVLCKVGNEFLYTMYVNVSRVYFYCEGEVKVVPVYALKTHGWSRGAAPLIFNLDTRCRSVVSFTPWSLYSGTHCIGGYVGPRAGLDLLEKRKDLLLLSVIVQALA
jgi:hypothetical protein